LLMNYQAIFLRAYHLTLRNPLLWVFGLFLSSGFNLNIFYALVSERSGLLWESIRNSIDGRPVLIGISGLSAILVFVIANYLKTWFISEVHELIHREPGKCALCVAKAKRETWQSRLPDLHTLAKVLLASVITVLLSSAVAAPLNYLRAENTSPSLIALSALAIFIIVCAIACWNIFTAFYVILHKQKFNNASKLSLDLMTLRGKSIFEFVSLLLIIYLAAVGVGSILITLAQVNVEWSGLALPVVTLGKAVLGLLFGAWMAVTSVFFNLSLFLFFDRLVKPIEKPEEVRGALPQSAQ
jgi:hypothetical protein